MRISRRQLLGAGLGGCLGCAVGRVWSKPLPTDLQPLMAADYKPSDLDERGMWHDMERIEESIADLRHATEGA